VAKPPPPRWRREYLALLDSCAADALDSSLHLLQQIHDLDLRLAYAGAHAEASAEELEALRRATQALLVDASAAFMLLH
jgi:hypothetical protein